jgi:transglutaminase-like putative cysteine protease
MNMGDAIPHKIGQSRGEEGIKETLVAMRKLVFASDDNRIIKEKARKLIAGISPSDFRGQIEAIFRWVQKKMSYVRDYRGVEELTRPDRIVYNLDNNIETHSSDCDDFAMVLAALLRSIGFTTRFEAVAVKTSEGYDHARVAVYSVEDNGWLVLEGTRKNANPGFRLPSNKPVLTLEL